MLNRICVIAGISMATDAHINGVTLCGTGRSYNCFTERMLVTFSYSSASHAKFILEVMSERWDVVWHGFAANCTACLTVTISLAGGLGNYSPLSKAVLQRICIIVCVKVTANAGVDGVALRSTGGIYDLNAVRMLVSATTASCTNTVNIVMSQRSCVICGVRISTLAMIGGISTNGAVWMQSSG